MLAIGYILAVDRVLTHSKFSFITSEIISHKDFRNFLLQTTQNTNREDWQ